MYYRSLLLDFVSSWELVSLVRNYYESTCSLRISVPYRGNARNESSEVISFGLDIFKRVELGKPSSLVKFLITYMVKFLITNMVKFLITGTLKELRESLVFRLLERDLLNRLLLVYVVFSWGCMLMV